MKIQSLSVVVPNKKCINNCKFCVSNMHKSEYENMITGKNLYFDLYMKDYLERLQYARENGCDTVMLTGDTEPQQNWEFLKLFGIMNKMLKNPFEKIEIQTTGTMLDNDYLYFLRHHVGITTISLSISSFYDSCNAETNQTPERYMVNINDLCKKIKQYRFNLRISINMTDSFNEESPHSIFDYCKNVLNADQVTIRELYISNNNTPQDLWIKEHRTEPYLIERINLYIKDTGRELERLDFGLTKYSVMGMGVVLDDDCMSTEVKDAMKYVILREDCKLYSKWDDKGSLIF